MDNPDTTPRTILLATDLSGRCDRALDRAALLALEWKARLVVVHAIEANYLMAMDAESDVPSWRRESVRRAAIANRQIRDDLLGRDVPFEVVIEEGDPTDIILNVMKDRRCDLIVTGTARSETFGRFILGTTVDKLAREAPVPVLVVKTRARHPYRKLVVAADFSDSSRRALESAVALFPATAMTLFHSYRPIAEPTQSKAAAAAEFQAAADACAAFLAEADLPRDTRARLEVLVESGHIASLLRAYAIDKGLDLLVIGSRGRSAIQDLLLGSTAAKLLSSAPCDVLVVRNRARARASAGPSP
jgi:nucleotide-binding universal stress UspA family protein